MKKIIQYSTFKIQRGFTLIELLIYAGLLSVLLGVFVTLFGMIIDAQLESNASSSVQQDGQYILAKLAHDISNADSITTPAGLGGQSSSLAITSNTVTYTYSIDANGNLIDTTVTGSDVLNSYDTTITDVNFTRLGNPGGKNSIQFTYTVTGKTTKKSGQEVQIFKSTAALR